MAVTSLEAKLWDALNNHLSTMAGAPPISWPGREFNPGSSQYIRATLLPAVTERITLGDDGYDRMTGIYQVSVYDPDKNRGLFPALETAGAVREHFKRAIISRNGLDIRIIPTPYISPPIGEPGWNQVPCNVPYQTDVPS